MCVKLFSSFYVFQFVQVVSLFSISFPVFVSLVSLYVFEFFFFSFYNHTNGARERGSVYCKNMFFCWTKWVWFVCVNYLYFIRSNIQSFGDVLYILAYLVALIMCERAILHFLCVVCDYERFSDFLSSCACYRYFVREVV